MFSHCAEAIPLPEVPVLGSGKSLLIRMFFSETMDQIHRSCTPLRNNSQVKRLTSQTIQNRSLIPAARFTLLLFPGILLVGAALAFWLYQLHGWTETGTLLFTRYTARLSFVLFLPVFMAKSLQIWWPTRVTSQLVRSRRQWGLAFALAHTIHLLAIVVYMREINQPLFVAENIPAGTIYLLMFLMVLTSNNYAVRHLKGAWKVLHKLGIYALFTGYFVTYLGRINSPGQGVSIDSPTYESPEHYVVLLILVSLALGLRITAFWKLRFARAAVS